MTESHYTHRTQMLPWITKHPKRTALAFFLIWGIGDWFSTLFMVSTHGTSIEANPFMKFVLVHSSPGFSLIKLGGMAVISWLIFRWRKNLWDNQLTVPVFEIFILWGIGVVIVNTLLGLGVIVP